MHQEQGIIFKTLEEFHKVELEDIMHYFGSRRKPEYGQDSLSRQVFVVNSDTLVENPIIWAGIPYSVFPKKEKTSN